MNEICPHCGLKFPANRAWSNRTVTGLLISPVFLDLKNLVRCPTCQFEFPATNYRYFGWISPKYMKIGLLLSAVMLVSMLFVMLDDGPAA